MKVLQINTTVNTTSTGRIAEEIGIELLKSGHISTIAYKRCGPSGSSSELLKIGNKLDVYLHGLKTRLFDLHGFGSRSATEKLINRIKAVEPDVIGLHNLHGYYINIEVLFEFLKKYSKPIVWTLHDCWPFTGHCAFFDTVNCTKWISGCYECPLSSKYPASFFKDNSENNYSKKSELFTGLHDLTIVTPSTWLCELVKKSFLKEYHVKVINNGIDTTIFSIQKSLEVPEVLKDVNRKIILGVASVWDNRKGLGDFIKLNNINYEKYQIVLVGLNKHQIRNLPDDIIGIERTENVKELATLYNMAHAFVNPTWSDNFPTTNIEALACGTPVITYDTGGSPEAIDHNTGIIVEKGDISRLQNAIDSVLSKDKTFFTDNCRSRAIALFNKTDRYRDYISLYSEKLLT